MSWVHVIPCPDLYRGKYKEHDACAVDKYCQQSERIMQNAVDSGRKVILIRLLVANKKTRVNYVS